VWTDGTVVSFDTETDSPNPEVAHIVTASVVVIDGTTGAVDRHEWLVAVEDDIPAEATAIHGITTAHARDHGEPARTVVRNVWQMISAACSPAPLIVYNAPFDLTLLDREMRRHYDRGAEFERPVPIIDPLVLDRALDKWRRGKRTLTAMSAHYGVPISDADAHGSTADALCAARVAWKIARRYPGSCEDLDALQVKQAGWHRAWAEHFAEYLRGQGKPADDVSPDWPLGCCWPP